MVKGKENFSFELLVKDDLRNKQKNPNEIKSKPEQSMNKQNKTKNFLAFSEAFDS